jgi:hypothetical protein
MISSFNIGNFKAFGASQTVPLKPITLVFGPNSAGKSSVLHSLLFAHESLRTGSLDVRETELGGKSVDLGGFQQLTHRCNPDNAVSLSFRFPEILPVAQNGWHLKDVTVNIVLQLQRTIPVDDDEDLDRLLKKFQTEQQWSEVTGEDAARLLERFLTKTKAGAASVPVLRRFEIVVDGEPLVQASRRPNKTLKLDTFSSSHPACRIFVENLVLAYSTTETFSEADARVVAAAFDALVPDLELDAQGICAKSCRDTSRDAKPGDLFMIQKEKRDESLRNHAKLFFPRIVAGLFDSVFAAFRGFFDRVDYLGPLRSYPPRHLAFDVEANGGKAEGAHAWRVVLENAAVREKVNRWLSSDFLKTKYELGVNSLVPLHLAADALETEFSEIVSERIEQHDADRDNHGDSEADERYHAPYSCGQWPVSELFRRMLWQMIQRSSRSAVPELTLRDKRTGTFVSHRDIGIGVSQLLPVLVNAYGSTGRVLAVEQPEIHLHPGLQSELADVFIESALGEQKNTFILETHSEHLILRILRRIRETRLKRLPAGCPAIQPEDVSILFIEPTEQGSEVRAMRVDPMGKIVDQWPGGFFEESFKELF